MIATETPPIAPAPAAPDERPLKLDRRATAAPFAAKIKPYTEATRAALAAYRDSFTPPLSLTQLGRELGINSSHISKYLGGKPECDVVRLEATIEDVIKSAALRRTDRATLFETPASRSIHSACELIRKTNDVGLIHGAAGLGKSHGVALYAAQNPSALVLTLNKWSGQADGLAAALATQMETRGKTPGVRRADWLVERLRGSNRLLLLDNAHRLTCGALQWLFDFYDACEVAHEGTGLAIALVGNPEVLERIRQNDQQFSRIGLLREVRSADTRALAAAMLQRLCPEHAEALHDLAERVVGQPGHLRALKKHLLLMRELLPAAKGDPRKAFLMTHTQVVSDYTLED